MSERQTFMGGGLSSLLVFGILLVVRLFFLEEVAEGGIRTGNSFSFFKG